MAKREEKGREKDTGAGVNRGPPPPTKTKTAGHSPARDEGAGLQNRRAIFAGGHNPFVFWLNTIRRQICLEKSTLLSPWGRAKARPGRSS